MLDKLIKKREVSKSGKGYILEFESPDAVQEIVENKNLFAPGGSIGGSLHKKELEEKFGKGGEVSDFRSFNGGNTAVGDRSLQVVLYTEKETGKIRGAYVDTDRFNPNQDRPIGAILHFFAEVVPFGVKKLLGEKC